MKKILSSILILAMLFTLFPTVIAADKMCVTVGNGEYSVKPGETFEVPVYLSLGSDGSVSVYGLQYNLPIPEGFTVSVDNGLLGAANITLFDEYVQLYSYGVSLNCDKTKPLCTVKYTANKEGTYTINLYGADNFAVDADNMSIDYDVVESTVKVEAATPVKTLESITVDPSEMTVPVAEQGDVLAYVKNNINSVTANYNTGSEVVTDYTVAMDGEDKAVVTYGGKQAIITITLEKPPVSDKMVVTIGNGTYSVKAGETFEVPVYLSLGSDGSVSVYGLQYNLPIPEGFTVSVDNGLLGAANITLFDEYVQLYSYGVSLNCDKTKPLCTVKYTANKEGTYTINLYGADNFAVDADNMSIDYDVVESTVTVTGGSTPAKVLDSIEISSAADPIVIPYGADAEETIRKAITVKAIYSNAETEDNVTGYDVAIDENVATISYTVDGTTKTATINIKYQPTPVLTVEKSEITVPYGTEDVEAYVKAEIKSGKVKLDETDLTFDDYVIEFTNGADTATVKYAKDETITATVSVKYVELDKINVVIKGDGTEVKIPWDSTDDATAVKALITVTAVFTNGAHDNEITNYTVDFGEGTFTVSYGGLTSEPIPYSKDAKPEAKVTGIKAEPTELNVPYANTVSNDEIIKFVKANVKVTATYDDESTSDVAEYGVTIAYDKATITYEGFTADVTLVKETRKLELSNTEITVDEGTDKDGIIAYVKANVTAKYVYSQTTAEQTIPVDELAITVNDELTEVTVEVGGESAKIAVNIKVVPNFVETVKADTNAYGIATAKLVIFTDVKDGKVVKVTDEKGTYDAIYMGNGKWAAVVTGSYTAFADNGSLPEAAKFGRLHDASMITAYDALLTLLKANNGAVNVFDNDYQKYLLADVDGNGTLTADEALYINRISLGNADESTLWFNK